jgi:hypothetical protein
LKSDGVMIGFWCKPRLPQPERPRPQPLAYEETTSRLPLSTLRSTISRLQLAADRLLLLFSRRGGQLKNRSLLSFF